jgi:hypothetical protein
MVSGPILSAVLAQCKQEEPEPKDDWHYCVPDHPHVDPGTLPGCLH